MKNLTNILEAILFVSGKEVAIDDIATKLGVSVEDVDISARELMDKYYGESGVVVLRFADKLQLSSNPAYVEQVSAVLSPIREKELTKAMLETLAIVAYKQPITRLEIEEVRAVDCSYALQTLSKLQMVKVLGRKDAVGKPLLFGTTDEFLKRFSLSGLDQLPDYDNLLDRIQTITGIATPNVDLYNSNRDTDYDAQEDNEEIPDFLKETQVDIINSKK
ncbi:MAG: SMC-Scp complex subunit ScpB [Clostridia bacterium]|nr:SMC-Scp complex subunit ScpB [Clostridia bacterium]